MKEDVGDNNGGDNNGGEKCDSHNEEGNDSNEEGNASDEDSDNEEGNDSDEDSDNKEGNDSDEDSNNEEGNDSDENSDNEEGNDGNEDSDNEERNDSDEEGNNSDEEGNDNEKESNGEKESNFDPTLNGRIPLPNDQLWDDIPYLFLHLPKSGGTSIASLLPPGCHYWHLSPYYYPSRILPKLITIVRNPYDRAVSAYFFFCNKGFMGEEQWCVDMMKPYPTFQQWVLNGLEEDMTYMDRQSKFIQPLNPMIMQTEWLLIERGQSCFGNVVGLNAYNLVETRNNKFYVQAERIGRFENLVADVKRLFGIDSLPHLHDSPHDHWLTYYQDHPDVQQKVYHLYRRDFKLLGYDEQITNAPDNNN